MLALVDSLITLLIQQSKKKFYLSAAVKDIQQVQHHIHDYPHNVSDSKHAQTHSFSKAHFTKSTDIY